jgi:hypothetical protein
VSGKVRVSNGITHGRSIVLAIGNIFQQGGKWLCFRFNRKPDPGGEPGAVSQRNPGIFYFADSIWKVGFDALHEQLRL